MENNQTPITGPSVTPEVPQDALAPTPTPSKNHKKLLWVLGIALVLAITAAITFAVLYFTKPAPAQPPVEPPTSEEEPPVSTDSEEVEITDTYALRDLDEKIAILHDTEQTGPTIERRGLGLGYGHSLPLYTNGILSDVAKLSHVVRTIVPDHYLTSDEMQSAIDEQGFSEEVAKEFRQIYNRGYKTETVVEKYRDVFGEELAKGAVNDQYYCPKFYYNATYDFYYDLGSGCGGTGPYNGKIYKNKYTKDDSHAYVYVNVGVFNGEDGKVYCDVIDYNASETNLPKVCGGPMEYSEFDVNENNYQDFAQYRFVFNRADNGTYYFVKVEKL